MAAVLAMLALVGGCSQTSEGTTGATGAENGDREATAASPSPPGSSDDPAVVAYVAMWEDTVVASYTSDAGHPRLDDHATGEALTLLKYVMEGHADEGHVARGGPSHDVTVVQSTPDRRELSDCMDDTDWLMYKANGELVDDAPGSLGLVEATVERRDDGWIVTDLILHEAGTC